MGRIKRLKFIHLHEDGDCGQHGISVGRVPPGGPESFVQPSCHSRAWLRKHMELKCSGAEGPLRMASPWKYDAPGRSVGPLLLHASEPSQTGKPELHILQVSVLRPTRRKYLGVRRREVGSLAGWGIHARRHSRGRWGGPWVCPGSRGRVCVHLSKAEGGHPSWPVPGVTPCLFTVGCQALSWS